MMHVVFTIPGLGWDVPGFGLMLMLGFLISIWWATRRAARSGANPDIILDCGFVALVAGVVGCRAMFVIHYWDRFKHHENALDLIWAILDVSQGGLEFYGGFVFTIIAVLAYLRWKNVSIRWYLDITAPSAALGLAIGRIGCFLNGCCYGGMCALPWAVTFPYASPVYFEQFGKDRLAEVPPPLVFELAGQRQPLTRESIALSEAELAQIRQAVAEHEAELAPLEAELVTATTRDERDELARKMYGIEPRAIEHFELRYNLEKYGMTLAELKALAAGNRTHPVHPTQLYSFITAGLIALFLDVLYWRRTRDGQVILTLLVIEPVTRWLIEVIRADNPIDTLGVFTISQGFAVGLTLLGIVGLIALRKLPRRSPRAKIWEPEADGDGGKKAGHQEPGEESTEPASG